MARALKRLTAVSIAALKKPGRHADGGNLYLTVSKTPGGLSKHWTFLFMLDGKQREAGFGPISTLTLSEAREKARQWRGQLLDGVDPLAAKQAARGAAKAAKAAEKARKTFGQCARELIKSKRSEWRSEVHAEQWRQTLTDCCAEIWDTPVDAVDTHAVLGVLTPIWSRTSETASRLRGRIEAVLDYAKAHKLVTGENPAAWKGNLAHVLPRRKAFDRSHHAAMPYREVPDFLAKLRQGGGVPATALEFTILTAARIGEVIGARWDEIDIANKVWTVPASRMKAGIEHQVPLSDRSIVILGRMAAVRSSEFVFPGHRVGLPVGYTTCRGLCPPGATLHGFRSSFRDWAGEETSFPRELAEHALAHAIGDKSEQAYRRAAALEKRRPLMEAWAAYCEPGAGGNVVQLRGAAGVA
jgi:integrase